MLKRTLLLLSVIFAGSLLIAITAKSDNQMIPSGEVQKMNELRNKMIESKAIKGQSALAKMPSMLDATPMVPELKQFKQSLSHKNKLMGMVQLKANSANSNNPQKNHLNDPTILKDQSLINPNNNRDCDSGYVDDCADDDCCPESWIGDGFADCEDQAYGCDLTCYDNDGGDCEGGGGTTGGGSENCNDCEYDFTPYGSECCDTAWDEYGINCADLEGNYNWDCSGCNCPGDGDPVCGDGSCNGDETYETCP
jgi:hypothetical protein